MNRTPNILAIITARGGSKGIPRKNISPCAGKPLIAHTIEAAKLSKLQHCIVSTDDPQIASVALEYGAKVPFMRPEKLAQDETPSIMVVQDALERYEHLTGELFDYTLILQPTSPLRLAEDINKGIELVSLLNPDSLVSLVELGDFSSSKIKVLKNGYVQPAFEDEQEGQRRQEREMLYKRNGALYFTRRDILLNNSLYGNKIAGFPMPPERSLDVNDQFDLSFAEYLINKRVVN